MWIEGQNGGLVNLDRVAVVLARPHRFGDARFDAKGNPWLVEAILSDHCGPIELATGLTESGAKAAVRLLMECTVNTGIVGVIGKVNWLLPGWLLPGNESPLPETPVNPDADKLRIARNALAYTSGRLGAAVNACPDLVSIAMDDVLGRIDAALDEIK